MDQNEFSHIDVERHGQIFNENSQVDQSDVLNQRLKWLSNKLLPQYTQVDQKVDQYLQ